MEPLLSRNSDLESNGRMQEDGGTGFGDHGEKEVSVVRQMPRKCKVCLCCSIALNAFGCLVLAFIVFTNQSYQPILPPPPKNASKVTICSVSALSQTHTLL